MFVQTATKWEFPQNCSLEPNKFADVVKWSIFQYFQAISSKVAQQKALMQNKLPSAQPNFTLKSLLNSGISLTTYNVTFKHKSFC